MNRNARRAMKRNGPKVAAVVAATCLDFSDGRLQPVTDPHAIDALRRAFERMLNAGGKPMAVPVSETAAAGFPVRKAKPMPGAAHWLVVGMDVAGRATFSLESVISENRSAAHDAARGRSLAALAKTCAFPGFNRPERV